MKNHYTEPELILTQLDSRDILDLSVGQDPSRADAIDWLPQEEVL